MNILFVCTGNSCRSQMAEGWARKLAPEAGVESAGLEAHGLNPRAIAAMASQGVDISKQTSDVLNDEMIERADLIVTVCSHADANCPIVPPGKRKLHIPFDDPAGFTGSEEEVRAGFDRVCLEIRKAVEKLLADVARYATE